MRRSYIPRHSIQCGDLTFVLVGWFHDDPNMCSHFKTDRECTNRGGEWKPVYVLDDGAPTERPVEVRPSQGEPRSTLSIRMSRALLREVTQTARSHGKTPADWCLDQVEAHVHERRVGGRS